MAGLQACAISVDYLGQAAPLDQLCVATWYEADDHTFRFDFLATEHGNEEEELIAQVVLGVDPAAARSKL